MFNYGIIIIAIGVLAFLFSQGWKDDKLFTTASLVIIGIGIISIGVFQEIDLAMDKKKLNTAIEQNYSVYLDGQEVDLDKIDLSMYETSVDTTYRAIYVTHK